VWLGEQEGSFVPQAAVISQSRCISVF